MYDSFSFRPTKVVDIFGFIPDSNTAVQPEQAKQCCRDVSDAEQVSFQWGGLV